MKTTYSSKSCKPIQFLCNPSTPTKQHYKHSVTKKFYCRAEQGLSTDPLAQIPSQIEESKPLVTLEQELVKSVGENEEKQKEIKNGIEIEKQSGSEPEAGVVSYKYTKERPKTASAIFGGRGWQGEKQLWDIREDLKGSTVKVSVDTPKKPGTQKIRKVKVKGSKYVQAKVVGSGRDIIYVGFDKEEMGKKARGEMGSYIVDNAQKYPAKEDIGIFKGATGGFQGGEVGLSEYVQTGDVLTPEQRQMLKKSNPIFAVGFLLGLASAGGVFFYTNPEAAQTVVDKASQFTLTDTQLFLLKGGSVFVGGLLGLSLIQSALSNLSKAVVSGAQKSIVLMAFCGGVVVVFRYVLTH